ncbi:MAG TPA: tail fiber protein [Bacilli bacterium]|nr:tail fiber protein [Bacilli bacterium]
MADAFIGEIRIFAGNFAPRGWALCNGQIMSIATNTALFAILGVQYGGDGKTTFALPNLNGKAPMGQGAGQGLTNRVVGQAIGSSTVTLLETEIPSHTHIPHAIAADGDNPAPTGNYWAQPPGDFLSPGTPVFTNTAPSTPMSPVALNVSGNSAPHNNMQPYLAMNYIICITDGEFPSHG